MEKLGDLEQKNLINELSQGREFAKQLQIQLNVSSSSYKTRDFLVQRILGSFDKTLSMLKEQDQQEPPPQTVLTAILGGVSESPRSLSTSPRSEDSEREFKDLESKDAWRKRKTLPRWTKQVQVCPGSGLQGPLDDGYSWRKYGQKDILGAKYPRGYYRCTHRNAHGCMATKQLQRSDHEPKIFEITYRGRHICNQASTSTSPPPPASSPPRPELRTKSGDHHQQQQQQQQQQSNPQEVLLNFKTGLRVITEDLDTGEQPPFPPFYLDTTSNVQAENYAYSSVSPFMFDNYPAGNFSPAFMSPATSGSNYFSMSKSLLNTFGRNQNLHSSEGELSAMIPTAATSATNSPTIGLDFHFGQPEFDPSFTFDN